MSGIFQAAQSLEYLSKRAGIDDGLQVDIRFENQRDLACFQAEIKKEVSKLQLYDAGMEEDFTKLTIYGIEIRMYVKTTKGTDA